MANLCYALYKSGDLNYGPLPMLFGMQLRNYDERVFDGFLESLKGYDVEGIVAAGEARARVSYSPTPADGEAQTKGMFNGLMAVLGGMAYDAKVNGAEFPYERVMRRVRETLKSMDRTLIAVPGETVAERIKKLIESEGDNLTDDYKAVLNAFVEAEDDDAFHFARREFNDRKWRDTNSLLYGADRALYDFLAKKPIC